MLRASLRTFGTSMALASVLLGSTLTSEAAYAAADGKNTDNSDRDTRQGEWRARVMGTGSLGLWIRTGPGQQYPAPVAVRDGAVLRVVQGPVTDGDGRDWFMVTGYDQQNSRGWSSGEFLQQISEEALDGAGLMVVATGLSPRLVASGTPSTRTMSARVTAYTNQPPEGGAHGTITKSGTTAHWGTVAVDPQIIPLGTRLLIEGLDGIFVAEDTGGGIQGNHVDVFFPDYTAAVRFGVQYRTVTIIP